MESNDMRCPKCGNRDGLAVVVKTWAVLSFGSAGEVVGSSVDGDRCPDHNHDWDGDSRMQCLECKHVGTAKDFSIERQDALADTSSPERLFVVDVCRTGFACMDIEIMARNDVQAEDKALDIAGNECFSDHASEYSANDVRKA